MHVRGCREGFIETFGKPLKTRKGTWQKGLQKAPFKKGFKEAFNRKLQQAFNGGLEEGP